MSSNCCGCELLVECVPVHGDFVLHGVAYKVEKVINVKVKGGRTLPWFWCVVGVCGDVATTLARDDTGVSARFYLDVVKNVVRHHNDVVQTTKHHYKHIDPEVLSHTLTYSIRCVVPHVSWFHLPLYYYVKAQGCLWSFGRWPWVVVKKFYQWVSKLEEHVLCLPTPCYVTQQVLSRFNLGAWAVGHPQGVVDPVTHQMNHPTVGAQTGQVVAP